MSTHVHPRYIIDTSLLEPADIILTGDKTIPSLGVKLSTLSRYSHAAIYVGGTTIEATLNGVFSQSIQRMIFKKENDVAVLRSKRKLKNSEALRICAHAQSKVGSLYALSEAITIRARSTLRIEETKLQFCSRLVANAYASIGYDFINLHSPAYCTPRQLSLCKAFERVNDIIKPATRQDIEFSESDDPSKENQRQIFEWLNNVRELIKRNPALNPKWNIQTISDVSELLLNHPELDKPISTFVEASGYLDHYKLDIALNPQNYKLELFIIMLEQISDRISFLHDQLERERNIIIRFTSMLTKFIELYNKRNLIFFAQHINLYTILTMGIRIRLEVIHSALIKSNLSSTASELESDLEYLTLKIDDGHYTLKQIPQR